MAKNIIGTKWTLKLEQLTQIVGEASSWLTHLAALYIAKIAKRVISYPLIISHDLHSSPKMMDWRVFAQPSLINRHRASLRKGTH